MYLQQLGEITKTPDEVARLTFVNTRKTDEIPTIYIAKREQIHVAVVDEKP